MHLMKHRVERLRLTTSIEHVDVEPDPQAAGRTPWMDSARVNGPDKPKQKVPGDELP